MKTRKIILVIISILIYVSAFSQKQNIVKVKATDPEGDEVIISISAGNSAGFFSITPFSGILRMDEKVYQSFIKQRTFTITIKACDETDICSKQKIKIILSKDKKGLPLPPNITKL